MESFVGVAMILVAPLNLVYPAACLMAPRGSASSDLELLFGVSKAGVAVLSVASVTSCRMASRDSPWVCKCHVCHPEILVTLTIAEKFIKPKQKLYTEILNQDCF